MAGNYMDAPNDRIAWDRDGSILTFISMGSVVTAQNATIRRALNDETEDVVVALNTTNDVKGVAVVFPLPMDCSAVFIAASDTNPTIGITVETSKDTTNGLDGTWSSQFLINMNITQAVKPNYRMLNRLFMLQPNSSSSDLRGVRFVSPTSRLMTNLYAFHIYGQPSPTATKDRLALWHPTLDIKLPPTWLDWGNVPRSSSEDRAFRIKNLSETLTAADIDVYTEALTPGSPSVAGMHVLSENGGATFLNALNLGGLAPGEITDQLIVRRVVPANAQVSTWSARLAADVNVWEV